MNIARILYQALNPYGTVSIRQYESGNFGGGGVSRSMIPINLRVFNYISIGRAPS
jgi:hypothetical protein